MVATSEECVFDPMVVSRDAERGTHTASWWFRSSGPAPFARRHRAVATRSGRSVATRNAGYGVPGRTGRGKVLAMRLPFDPPIEPMLAKASDALPEGDGWLFEPKWDGFRAIVFRDGDEVYTQSRDLKPLDRYFPELAAPFRAQLPERCVLDGEVVIARDGGLAFEALLLRIHPAESRVRLLAAETPASFVAWDLLALGDEDLRGVPQGERRARLEAVLGGVAPPVHLTPATRDRTIAADWFDRFEGAGLDGVVAKRLDGVYQPGKRAMLKIKHERTADCVVAGFRWHKNGPGTHVGSLLLGLFDETGTLHHVGITSSFTWERRAALVEELAPLREGALDGHPWAEWAEWSAAGSADASGQRLPGAGSRWNRGKDLSWEPLRTERVAEVAYDHLQGDRFRHATTFRRWRPDKAPEDCRYDQLETTTPFELSRIFGVDV
jgi:ATP-dependent DNA ligase